MPLTSLHRFDWNQPLLPQAVRWLARDWGGAAPLELSDQWVIVPTRQAGRRLREALAAHAAGRNQAVFPPEVLLPESIIARGLPESGVASRHEALFAWMHTLLGVRLEEFAEVFPVPPTERNTVWAARLARQFLDLQQQLAESGLRMADVVARANGPFPEAGRWAQLARLESRYDRALADRGLRDPQAARIEAAARPAIPQNVTRISLLATPDPLPIAIEALEHIAEAIPVEIGIPGPGDEPVAELFDAWGRPRPSVWQQRPVAFPDFAGQVRLCVDPADQAARLADLAHRYPQAERTLAIGIADAELNAVVANTLAETGVLSHDPEGVLLRREPLYELVRALLDLQRENTFAHAARLARCPDILAWHAARAPGLFSASRFLAGLDELHRAHLPVTLDAARALARAHSDRGGEGFPDVVPALERLAELLNLLQRAPFPDNITAVLTEVYGAREFDSATEEGARMREAATKWSAAVSSVAEARRQFPDLSDTDALEHALATFAEDRRFPDKPPGAIDLQGWLELLWEDAPHLVVAGLNDGRVPAAVVDDPFLPETLRERLGMKNNADRFARDLYILHCLTRYRAAAGRLDLLLGKTNAVGEPLRPSRLLLTCTDDALPKRVQALFRELEAPAGSLPWHRAWKLCPGKPVTFRRIAVTGFRSYLQCPFRFYLRHGLRMEPVDPFKNELDALDFGILCHDALEAMGRDPAMRDSVDAGELRDFLIDNLERRAATLYGHPLPITVMMQLESARQRLGKAALVQARERAEGWSILDVEHKFELEIDGMTVSGKIDRIDRNETTGQIRVLDYKTSDKADAPADKHRRKLGRKEDPATLLACSVFEIEGTTWVWEDLQLPLYRRAMAASHGADILCGYFNLPKSIAETGVYSWDGFDHTWQQAADHCADGIVAAVKTGRFWPPNEDVGRYDDFAHLFHRGVAESIDWPEVVS